MRLHINIDHIATLRNARGTTYPDPVEAALQSEKAGANGITAHLREDRRHIGDADMAALRRSVTTLLNMEMAATLEMTEIARRLQPDVITLVPERREERTTEGGLDTIQGYEAIERVARMCRERHIKLSTFIEPNEAQIRASKDLGATQIELHTGEYCRLSGPALEAEWVRLRDAAQLAHRCGLEVAAGHGLSVENLPPIAGIPEIVEVNIGHAVIADAVFLGLSASIERFRDAIVRGRAADFKPWALSSLDEQRIGH